MERSAGEMRVVSGVSAQETDHEAVCSDPYIHRGETGWANALVSPSKMADVGSGE